MSLTAYTSMTHLPGRQQQHQQPRQYHPLPQRPIITSPISKRSPLVSSRIASRNRSSRSALPDNHPHAYSDQAYMQESTSTELPASPTPKKGAGRQKKGHAKQSRGDDGATGQNGEGMSGMDELFSLLGVTSPPPQDSPSGATVSAQDESSRGILAISKTDIERGNKTKGRGPKRQEGLDGDRPQRQSRRGKGVDSDGPDMSAQSEGEAKRKRQPKKGRGKGEGSSIPTSTAAIPISTMSASRPKGGAQRQPRAVAIGEASREDSDDECETASLSQSLPSERLFGPSRITPLAPGLEVGEKELEKAKSNRRGKGKGKKANAEGEVDESLAWEMPEIPGPSANQALTWQQKLQSSTSTNDSPRRSTKSASSSNTGSNNSPAVVNSSDRRTRSRPTTSNLNSAHPPSAMPLSPLVQRPTHARRASLDNMPVSAFDHTQPFHTGFNVHRAPQTPAKMPGNMAPAQSFPVLTQDFPRIGKVGYVPTPPAAPGIIPMPPVSTPAHAKIKYAGPTFHNSPHGASLPKPDLDDF